MCDYVPDKFKTQELCDKAIEKTLTIYVMFQIDIKREICVI